MCTIERKFGIMLVQLKMIDCTEHVEDITFMLNENKVKMMTKMAIYEKNDGRRILKTAKYFKSDYVSFGVLKTVIAATFAFIVLFVMIIFSNMQWLTDHLDQMNYSAIGGRFVMCYLAFILFFSAATGFVYARQYDESRKELKKFFSRLNKLEHFYNLKDKKTD